MLFQGHLWSCRRCHHRNWADMAALKPTLVCEVCGASAEVPVDVGWRFRPNQFLIESLRDHSVLSTVWVLSELRNKSQSSFMYAPSTIFGYTRERGRSAEADLLVVSDGNAILCEVKSSWQLVRAIEVNDFVDLACRAMTSAYAALTRLEENPPETVSGLRTLEANCAASYFRSRMGIPIKWRGTSRRPIPDNWRSIGPRSSPYHLAGNRNAAHPVNAILNMPMRLSKAKCGSKPFRRDMTQPSASCTRAATDRRNSFSI